MYYAEKRKKYVNEWLQVRVDQGLSAWTVQLEAKAMGKLYGISPDDENYFKPPKRNREDIKRSRGDRVRDRHFSKTNNDELIKFCRGTGLRRKELQELRGKDLVSREQIEAEISSWRASRWSRGRRASQSGLKCSRTPGCSRRGGLSMFATERGDVSV